MNLKDQLRQLKTIAPDAHYTAQSRISILSATPARRMTLAQFLLQNLQIGSAIALTGLLLLVGFGGFSAWKSLSPFGLSSLDPARLRAEAEAINDFQLTLQSVTYTLPTEESPLTADAEGPTVMSAAPMALSAAPSATTRSGKSTEAAATSSEELVTVSEEAATSALSVDQALDLLLQ